MSDQNDAAFFEMREKQERVLAARAQNPSIAAIYAQMADNYANRIEVVRDQSNARERADRRWQATADEN